MATHKQQQTHINNLIIPKKGCKLVRIGWEYKYKGRSFTFMTKKKRTSADFEFYRPVYRIEQI